MLLLPPPRRFPGQRPEAANRQNPVGSSLGVTRGKKKSQNSKIAISTFDLLVEEGRRQELGNP
jgi:hypothetical protein